MVELLEHAVVLEDDRRVLCESRQQRAVLGIEGRDVARRLATQRRPAGLARAEGGNDRVLRAESPGTRRARRLAPPREHERPSGSLAPRARARGPCSARRGRGSCAVPARERRSARRMRQEHDGRTLGGDDSRQRRARANRRVEIGAPLESADRAVEESGCCCAGAASRRRECAAHAAAGMPSSHNDSVVRARS